MAGDQAVHRVVERPVRGMLRGSDRRSRGDGPLGQLEGVAEVPPGERRVAEVVEGDPPEGDMDPDVVAAPLEREPEGVAGGLGRRPCEARSLPRSRAPSRGRTWDGSGRSRRRPAASGRGRPASTAPPGSRRRRPADRRGRPPPWAFAGGRFSPRFPPPRSIIARSPGGPTPRGAPSPRYPRSTHYDPLSARSLRRAPGRDSRRLDPAPTARRAGRPTARAPRPDNAAPPRNPARYCFEGLLTWGMIHRLGGASLTGAYPAKASIGPVPSRAPRTGTRRIPETGHRGV